MAKIRFALRGQATVLMGKNTMIRKIINTYVREHPGHPFELVRRELKRLLVISAGLCFSSRHVSTTDDVRFLGRAPEGEGT